MRDVREVAERARDVAFLNGAVELLGPAAADDIDEVLHVAIRAAKLAHDLALLVDRGCRLVGIGDEAPALAIDDVADAHAIVLIHARGVDIGAWIRAAADDARLRRQATHLED